MERLKIAVVCIGDELLKGFTVNTNLSDMGATLLKNGFTIDNAIVIPDKKDVIQKTLHSLLKSGIDVVIFSGGLGPTVDDLTKPAVAEACGVKLIMNNKIASEIKSYWNRRDKRMPPSVINQALIPEGADYFINTVGTAPGLLIKPDPEKLKLNIPVQKTASLLPALILLPGPPSELNPMFIKDVIPYLKSLSGFLKVYCSTIFVTDLPESNIEEKTLPLIKKSGCSIAYCASPEAVKVYISGDNKEKLAEKTEEIRNALGDHALPEEVTDSVRYIVNYCKKNRLTISLAESCTGGLIAAAVTDIPGASAIFKGCVVSYSNEWKHQLLGVSEETLENFGAVSSECAEEMVVNLCDKYKTDIGISVTGIAGPGGGTSEKPAGLVYIGIKYRVRSKKQNENSPSASKKISTRNLHKTGIIVKKFNFSGDRNRVRQRTLYTACNLLRTLLLK
jgi:nicotinamide-nucleotide amidase